MTKQVNVLPNERVDIPDFKAATQDFTDGSNQERFRAIFQDKFPHVPEGFRLEVADQGSFPGQITVHNGVSFDRDGQIVTSSAAADTNRSVVLTGTTTYYLEIELATEFADVDARGFWDPRFDNGADPSGDVRPDGREFAENVSTRVTPEWRIVTPVSTTDFDINVDPNSVKIPIAVIDVVAGVVTGGSTLPLRTTLREDILGGVTVVKVMNSRSMPSTFDITLDTGLGSEETVTVGLNDPVNGILTLSGPTAAPHNAGARVSVAGGTPAAYLPQRQDPKLPTAGTEGARPRLYHGDEETGHALIQNADAISGQADTQVDSLKNYVDFLAAQIRQLKVGAARSDQVGNVAPPSSFSSSFRYYENAGSVLGARTNAVSVGDGVTSWGDFNTVQAGDAPTAIQAAIDSVPTGGVLYIKAGTYDMISAVTINKPIHVIGDGVGVTVLDTSAATSAVIIDTSGSMSLRNLSITASGAAPYAVLVTEAGAQSVVEDCAINGLNSTLSTRTTFRNVVFTTPASGDDAVLGIFTDFLFEKCTFGCSIALAAARAVQLSTGTTKGRFIQCEMSTSNTTPTAVIRMVDDTSMNVKFVCCTVAGDGGGTAVGFEFVNGTMRDVYVTECDINCPSGAGDFQGSSVVTAEANVVVQGCRIAVPADGEGLSISGSGVTVEDCVFTQATSGAGTTGTGVQVVETTGTPSRTVVKDSTFLDCDIGVDFSSLASAPSQVQVTGNKINCPTASRGRVGILFSGTTEVDDGDFSHNAIQDLDDDSGAVTSIFGISLADTAELERSSISHNVIRDLGSQSAVNIADASGIDCATGTNLDRVSIDGNLIDNVQVDEVNTGINIQCTVSVIRNIQICGNQIADIGNAAGGTLGSQVSYGIVVRCAQYVNIGHNNLADIGSSSATTVTTDENHPSAILIGAGGLGESLRAFTVVGNTINSVRHGATRVCGIMLIENMDSGSISGNTIKGPFGAALAIGIYAVSTTGSAVRELRNISVTGNSIGLINSSSLFEFGIFFDLSASGGLQDEGQHSINGNSITGYDGQAIRFIGANALNVSPVSICGNTTFSDEDGADGIFVLDASRVAIAGNAIETTSTAAVRTDGICVEDCASVAVNGNAITSVGATVSTRGIAADDCINAAISGNMVSIQTGTGIDMNRDDQLATGNVVTSAGATAISIVGGGIKVLVDNSGGTAVPNAGTVGGLPTHLNIEN